MKYLIIKCNITCYHNKWGGLMVRVFVSIPKVKGSNLMGGVVATPLWGKCEDETRTPKSGNLESSETPTTLEFDCRSQNTSSWGVLYIVEKVFKCRCQKWPCMSHSDICSTSYGQKKGRESNSRPLKVGNWPDPGCTGGVQHTVGNLSRRTTSLLQSSSQSEVWAGSYGLPKSRESKPGQFRDSSLGILGIKAIRMRVRWSNAKNTIWGKVVASPESRPWWIKWVRVARGLSQHQKCFRRWTNQLMVGFDAGPSN